MTFQTLEPSTPRPGLFISGVSMYTVATPRRTRSDDDESRMAGVGPPVRSKEGFAGRQWDSTDRQGGSLAKIKETARDQRCRADKRGKLVHSFFFFSRLDTE